MRASTGTVEARGQGFAAQRVGLGHPERLRRLGRDLDPGQPMADLEQVLQHRLGLGAEVVELGEPPERARQIALRNVLEQRQDPAAVGEPQHVLHLRRADRRLAIGRAEQRDRLIEQGQPVAHRAFGGAHQQRQRARLDPHPLLGRDLGQMAAQALALDPPEIEALAAREHRDRDLAHLGGGEDEDGLRRRLLEGLEQAVEGLLRQHVDLVHDVDLEARRGRGVAHAVDQLAHVVDAGAGRGVHLQHVDVAALGDPDAVRALAAGLGRRLTAAVRADAVERPGDDPRGGGLADAANPGQEEGVRDAAGAQRIGQRADQRLLADQLGQALRPVGPRQDPVGIRALTAGRVGALGVFRGAVGHRG